MKTLYRFLQIVLVTAFFQSKCLGQSETMSTGSFIINMGATNPNTIANGLKPYGLIYDLLRNHRVPVKWVIGAGKVKDGVDFTFNGTSFRGGTFIIPAEFRSAAVNARITLWQGRGVVGITTNSPLTVTVTQTLTTFPKWTMDAQNGDIAEEYLINAGITNTAFPGAYNWKLPSTLDLCDDFFVMPHADPTWATHGNLLIWNKTGLGTIWAACHAVSALENCINPSDQTQQMNFLSTRTTAITPLPYPNNSLTLWGNHDDGTPPFTNQHFDDPIAQFLGSPDLAMTNGSEQIFLPKQNPSPNNTRWRPGVKFIYYDPTHPDVPSPDIANGNVAAAMVYGRAFDDPTRGYVMYMAGHDHNRGNVADVAAQRAFFNFSLFQAQAKSFQIASINLINGQEIVSGSTIPVMVNIIAPQAGATFTYAWSSSCGAIFANPNAASTTFTAPVVTGPTPCVITCEVTDNCGRKSFNTYVVIINCPTVSGNVFNDADGLTDAVIDGPGTNAGGLFAVLINQSGNVVSVSNVDNTGSYSFSGVLPGNYSILITTTSPNIGNPAPAASLPAGWVNTGEGTTASGDGNPNGQTSIFTVSTTDISNVNFGINQVPTADPVTASSQVNPGGATQVTVPLLTGSDPEDGTYTGVSGTNTIIIQTLPSNGILFYNGTPVTAGQTITNYNPSLLTLDPDNGAITVTFTYSEVDAAGTPSAAAAVSMGFFTVGISGIVYNDANGMTDGTVNGTGTNAGGLYAILLSGTTVAAVIPVNSDGTFSFPTADPGTYSVMISNISPNVGDPAPGATLPSGWLNTGEGTTPACDGNVNGHTNTFALSSADMSSLIFGINQIPTADPVTAASQVNPGGTIQVTVPVLTGSDPEDGVYTGVSGTNTIIIQTLPSNGTLYYNGTPVTAGQVITNYNPSQLTADPSGGPVTVTFTYSVVDAAGVPSTPNTVIMPFGTLSISGQVFNDIDGMNDGAVDGTGTNAGGLNAVLLDGTTVVAVAPVLADGQYDLTGIDAGTYSVMITTAVPTPGDPAPSVILPAGWVNTGEGTTSAGDGNVNGQTNTFILSSTDITDVNFGIEQLPTPLTISASGQENPEGTNQVTVPPAIFGGTDPAGGIITSMIITGFPTNVTSITINGITYSSINFPPAGVQVPTNSSGEPTQPISIDPADGLVVVEIPYVVIDNADQVSTMTGTAIMPFTTTLPVILLEFTATKKADISALTWITTEEANSSHMEVERSADGRSYTKIGRVEAAGFSQGNRQYGYDDRNPLNGMNYYRLKLVDRDGSYSYSQVRMLKFEKAAQLDVYPNPATTHINISFPQDWVGKDATIEMYNNAGQRVNRLLVWELMQNLRIKVDQLPNGTYHLRIQQTGQSPVTRTIQVVK